MNTSLRNRNIPGSLLAAVLACGLVACTTTESNPSGTGGSGSGGTGTAGTTTPTGNGGAAGGTTGTSAGSDGTLCPPPQQTITDFTYTPSDAGVSTTEVRFGSSGTLQGGESTFPSALTSDVTKSSWHISGTVSDYAGFSLYFDNCDHINAQAFSGISFTISGSVPHGSAITMGMGTLNDTPTAAWLLANGKTTAKATDAGKCTPTSGTQYYHPGCGDPTAQISVTSATVTQNILWGSLTGGTPDPSPAASGITSIYWFFPWTGAGGTPYAVDLVIDDLKFIP